MLFMEYRTAVTVKVPARERRPKFNYYHSSWKRCVSVVSLRNSQSINQKSGESPPCCSTYYKQPFFLPLKPTSFFFPLLPNPITFFCVLLLLCLATGNCATQHSWNVRRGTQSREKNAGEDKSWLKEDDDAIRDTNGN